METADTGRGSGPGPADRAGLTAEFQDIRLRRFTQDDIAVVASLANDKVIADMTRAVPHPYGEEQARQWIQSHDSAFERGNSFPMAVTLKKDGSLVGAVELAHPLNFPDDTGEIGFWIGEAYRGHGYAWQASQAMLSLNRDYGWFKKIIGYCLALNPASARTLEKLGLKRKADPMEKTEHLYYEKDAD